MLLTVIVTLRFAKLTAGSDFFARYIFPGLFIIGAAEAKNFKFHLSNAGMPSSEDGMNAKIKPLAKYKSLKAFEIFTSLYLPLIQASFF